MCVPLRIRLLHTQAQRSAGEVTSSTTLQAMWDSWPGKAGLDDPTLWAVRAGVFALIETEFAGEGTHTHARTHTHSKNTHVPTCTHTHTHTHTHTRRHTFLKMTQTHVLQAFIHMPAAQLLTHTHVPFVNVCVHACCVCVCVCVTLIPCS